MGKNANQIATFADLNSIGYRVPNTTKKVVVYKDLLAMEYVSSSDLYKMKGITLNIESMDDNKCITWDAIPGTSGQNPSTNGVTCPVTYQISSSIPLDSSPILTFLYNYLDPNSGETFTKEVGNMTANWGGVCYVLANPYINGVTKDWLSIKLSCPKSVTVKFFKKEFNMTETLVGSYNGKDIYIWTDVRDERTYNQTLQNLEKITFTIS